MALLDYLVFVPMHITIVSEAAVALRYVSGRRFVNVTGRYLIVDINRLIF